MKKPKPLNASAIARLAQTAFANRVPVARLAGSRCEVKNAGGDNTVELYIYGEIAWYEITAQMVAEALSQVPQGTQTIVVHLNSPGGDVFDGVAIYNLLRNRPENVIVKIDALAASIASVIAMAGDEIVIAKNAMMMIHRASGFAIGTADDMRALADILESIETDMIVPTYVDQTGLPAVELMDMMKSDTWMKAAVCVEKGFADRIGDDTGAKAMVRHGMFANMPKEIASAAEWKCDASRELTIDEESVWDAGAAAERVFDDAGFNAGSPDPEKAKRAFLVFDALEPKKKGSYKFPFADIMDGKLTALKSGLNAASSCLSQSDIPPGVKDSAQAVIDTYKNRMDEADSAAKTAMARLRSRMAALSLAVA